MVALVSRHELPIRAIIDFRCPKAWAFPANIANAFPDWSAEGVAHIPARTSEMFTVMLRIRARTRIIRLVYRRFVDWRMVYRRRWLVYRRRWLVDRRMVIRRRRVLLLRAVRLHLHKHLIGLAKVIAWNRVIEAHGRTAAGVFIEAFGHLRAIAQEPWARCKLRRESAAELQIANTCWYCSADTS